MASFLDIVFPTDEIVEFVGQDQSASIIEDFGRAGEKSPQVFEYLMARCRVGAPLLEEGETLTEFQLGIREGRREMALELLAILKLSQMNEAELQELIDTRKAK